PTTMGTRMDKRPKEGTSSFSQRLLRWYRDNKRDFAWREMADPYKILIAEMMLRRTRAAQVVPVFRAFLSRFPTPQALAEADPAEVLKVLKPLGLYWRIAQFQTLANELERDFGGRVPATREQLQS